MANQLFHEFLISDDTLRVYHKDRLIFSSDKGQLRPLLEYISIFAPKVKGVTVFDRVVGNAAALLLKKASCLEVYSPLGSELAARTLQRHGIRYHFSRTVPYILNEKGDGMCPMERLSLEKGAEEFFELLRRK